jgi:branched-chain amino acid transport system ATP-binding protein
VLLELRGVRKAYHRTPVIKGLDLAIERGEFVGLIGPNGAGKTTAFGLIAGHLTCDAGSVRLDDRDITTLDADARCRAGIGRTFQTPQPFAGLTVYENVLVAATFGAGLRGAHAAQASMRALRQCGLAPIGDAPAGALGLLPRKRLEVARALATAPKLLLLDEVGGGLTDAEAHQLLELVREIHAGGVTVLWIEHLVHALVQAVQRLVVLHEGALLADGAPHDVIARRIVRETYLGSELELQEEVAGVAQELGGAAHL